MNKASIGLLAMLELVPADSRFPRQGGVPSEMLDKLKERYPSGVVRDRWKISNIDAGDPYLHEIIEYAKSIGISIPVDQSVVGSGIFYKFYHPQGVDLRIKSPFVEMRLVGPIPAEIGFPSDALPFVVNDLRLKKNRKLEIGGAFAFPEFILVRGETKRKILEAGLKGLSFARMKLGENRLNTDPAKLSADWPEGIEPLYLMTSEVELPVSKNWMFDDAGRVFHPRDRGFESKMYYPLNGRENSGRLHYSKDEIAPFLEFDVVRTYEHYTRNQPKILVSKRFREVFNNLGIKGMKYDLGYYAVVDDSPWELGTDGPRHPRYSGPPPNPPVD